MLWNVNSRIAIQHAGYVGLFTPLPRNLLSILPILWIVNCPSHGSISYKATTCKREFQLYFWKDMYSSGTLGLHNHKNCICPGRSWFLNVPSLQQNLPLLRGRWSRKLGLQRLPQKPQSLLLVKTEREMIWEGLCLNLALLHSNLFGVQKWYHICYISFLFGLFVENTMEKQCIWYKNRGIPIPDELW